MRHRVFEHTLPVTLFLEPTDHVHVLRKQTDVPQNRNATLSEKRHRRRHERPALHLHTLRTGFLHNASGRLKSLLRGLLVGAKRQINDDAGLAGAIDNCLAMPGHDLERYLYG